MPYEQPSVCTGRNLVGQDRAGLGQGRVRARQDRTGLGQSRTGQGRTGQTATWVHLSVVLATGSGQHPASVPLIQAEHGGPVVSTPASYVEGCGFRVMLCHFITFITQPYCS